MLPVTIDDNEHNRYANAFWFHSSNSDDKSNDNHSNINARHAQFPNGAIETLHAMSLDLTCKSIVTTMHGSWSLEKFFIDAIINSQCCNLRD